MPITDKKKVNFLNQLNMKLDMFFILSAVDQAVSAFEHLQKYDPYRLDNMDTYSNLLYVKVVQ